jgi:hypothetical protein
MGENMDFDDAIVSHLKWKMYLHNFLVGRGKAIHIDQVGNADACMLGKWINGEGKQYEGMDQYRELVMKHNLFHDIAAEVVKKAKSGDKKGAEELLSTGEFFSVSREIVSAILLLETVVTKQKTTPSDQ